MNVLFSASRPFLSASPTQPSPPRIGIVMPSSRAWRTMIAASVVAGGEDRVGLLAADLRENRLEVRVARAVADRVEHLAAERREVLRDRLGEADRVVLLNVLQDRDLPRLQIVVRELGEHLALERIDEADAEDVVADLA